MPKPIIPTMMQAPAAAAPAPPTHPQFAYKSYGRPPDPNLNALWTQTEDEHLKQVVSALHPPNSTEPIDWYSIAYHKSQTQLPGRPNRTHMECMQRHRALMLELQKPPPNKAVKKAPSREKKKDLPTWTEEEDEKIKELVDEHLAGGGKAKWSLIAEQFPGKTAKRIRERWHLVLDPSINKSPWTYTEDRIIILSQLNANLCNKWVEISKQLPGRTDNAIKNHWNFSIKKKFEQYLFKKNIGRDNMLYDDFGNYMLDVRDVDACLAFMKSNAEESPDGALAPKEATSDDSDDAFDEDEERTRKPHPRPATNGLQHTQYNAGPIMAGPTQNNLTIPNPLTMAPSPKRRKMAAQHFSPYIPPRHAPNYVTNSHQIQATNPHQTQINGPSIQQHMPKISLILTEIQKLQKSMTAMQSMANELLIGQNELKREVQILREARAVSRGDVMQEAIPRKSAAALPADDPSDDVDELLPTNENEKNEDATNQKESEGGKQPENTNTNPEIAATDQEMNSLIVSRKLANKWPPNLPLKAYTRDPSLLKLRFHRSLQHQHLPVQIPPTGGKTPRQYCRLCKTRSKRGQKRFTMWMCGTCCVPLCVRNLPGEDRNMDSHFLRWHTAQDLEAENVICSQQLVSSIDRRKKLKEETGIQENDFENGEEDASEDESDGDDEEQLDIDEL